MQRKLTLLFWLGLLLLATDDRTGAGNHKTHGGDA